MHIIYYAMQLLQYEYIDLYYYYYYLFVQKFSLGWMMNYLKKITLNILQLRKTNIIS